MLLFWIYFNPIFTGYLKGHLIVIKKWPKHKQETFVLYIDLCVFNILNHNKFIIDIMLLIANLWVAKVLIPIIWYQICERRYNSFLAINFIHLHWNNMGIYKNHPFMASPGAETSDIIKNVPLLAS